MLPMRYRWQECADIVEKLRGLVSRHFPSHSIGMAIPQDASREMDLRLSRERFCGAQIHFSPTDKVPM